MFDRHSQDKVRKELAWRLIDWIRLDTGEMRVLPVFESKIMLPLELEVFVELGVP